MAIGERIHFFRTMRGMTQKVLGVLAGFPKGSADVRMAQYEGGARCPKEDLTKTLADILDVSPAALSVPDIDSSIGLMHTLFTLEDIYGLTAENRDGELILRIDPGDHGRKAFDFLQQIEAWADESGRYRDGQITKEEYDRWRYHYPKGDTTGRWHHILPEDFLGDLKGVDKED